jgi:uncharacterized Ntn-hydrolase superfamily protein
VTYSIVARDPSTGQLGVAVQSHWFSVGPIVPWARAGVGAVATQANVAVAHGPRALELLEAGLDADGALARLLDEDRWARTRQVAVVDGVGRVAVHTGEGCIPFAGHLAGEGFSCQGNMMASPRVWEAMHDAFAGSAGQPIGERLMLALEAAEAEGGDVRGRQSAALIVVPAEGAPWRSELSLRVEDDPEPLAELRRLLGLQRAYELAGQADELVAAGRHEEAAALFRRASRLQPHNHELRFWAGLGAAQVGELDAAVADVRAAIAAHPRWRELLERLPPEVAPAAAAVRARLTGEELTGEETPQRV